MILGRPYYGTDYEMVSGWWEGHGWPSIAQAILPATGVIVEVDGIPAAAGWLKLESTTPLGMTEWLVTNPKLSARPAVLALAELLEQLKAIAKAQGRTHLFAAVHQESLAKLYVKKGFEVSDREMIHLVCPL